MLFNVVLFFVSRSQVHLSDGRYDSGLNLTATRNGLDLAHSHGVRVLVDVDMGVNNFPMGTAAAKERIAKLRNHPAVIGWYTSDERGLDYLPVLRDLHSFASTEDIDHPTWSVFTGGQVADLEDFVEVFDVAGEIVDVQARSRVCT